MLTRRVLAPRFTIDIESRSLVDLPDAGGYRYAEDPSTEMICACFRNESEKHIWAMHPSLLPSLDAVPGAMIHLGYEPPDILKKWRDERVMVPFNAEFELAMFEQLLNFKFPRVEDPMAAAAYLQLPTSLDGVCRALGIGSKLAEGKTLIEKYSIPDKRTGHLSEIPFFYADDWFKYCMMDADLTWEVDQKLSPWYPEGELEVYRKHLKINNTGVPVDLDLAAAVIRMAKEVGDTPVLPSGWTPDMLKRVEFVRAFLSKNGVHMDSLTKKNLEDVLAQNNNLPEPVKQVIDGRLGACRVSVAKMEKILRVACSDGRLRGQYLYYGGTTGRWSSRGVQIQNLPKPPHPKKLDHPGLIAAVKGRDPRLAAIRGGGSVADALVSCVRPVIQAPDGWTLCVSDYAQVEARKVLWLAMDDYHLDWWRTRDMYSEMASRLFGREVIKGRDDKERDVGKRCILSCNFQTGGDKFEKTCHLFGCDIKAMGLNGDEVVAAFRLEFQSLSHPETGWWAELTNGHLALARGECQSVTMGRVVAHRVGRHIYGILPSGRVLVFRNVTVEKEIRRDKKGRPYEVWNVVATNPDGSREKYYGGKWADNYTQASCADFQRDAVMKIDEALDGRIKVTQHTHDEVVSLIRNDVKDEGLKFMINTMSTAPAWAKNFPLACEAKLCERYTK